MPWMAVAACAKLISYSLVRQFDFVTESADANMPIESYNYVGINREVTALNFEHKPCTSHKFAAST